LALRLALLAHGVTAAPAGIALIATGPLASVRVALEAIAAEPPPDPVSMAFAVEDRALDKLDCYLDPDLQARVFASRMIDASDLSAVATSLVAT
jgi:hypothetical protein